jgi:hypothetical protein
MDGTFVRSASRLPALYASTMSLAVMGMSTSGGGSLLQFFVGEHNEQAYGKSNEPVVHVFFSLSLASANFMPNTKTVSSSFL